MADFPTEDVIDEARQWSPLGVLVSARAWQALEIEALLGHAAPGARAPVLQRVAGALAKAPGAGDAPPPRPGLLMVAALLEDVLRYIADVYCLEQEPGVLSEGLAWAGQHMTPPRVEHTLRAFTDLYPPPSVRRGVLTAQAQLDLVTTGRASREVSARELLLLALAMHNRGMRPFRPLFDDASLRAVAPYATLVTALEAHFDAKPPVRGLGLTLVRALRAPQEASPDDLEGQLDFVLREWAALLPEWLKLRILRVRDVAREETVARGGGPGPVEIPRFGAPDEEVEAFTEDQDWMSNLVLIAKQTHVWLDQLSRAWHRPIRRLDQVPDEELDRLARWGFSGLWLIGLWQRSPASAEIKRRMGNPEALSSAYSLYDYAIADDLGGEAAFDDLRVRARRRGLRLAADMVPNHVGIYSRWVVEHPEWFLQLDHPPFPGYRFTGPDLSWHPDIEIRLEDGYWSHSDAAVVFQWRHKHTGRVRYMYHGNDGTQMPWNDTAQLDYLNPEVREAVIGTIVGVARRFPIIRFDAAMTLAKKHVQRLWFPPPGEGGAIPSRAHHGLVREDFERAMPQEFWREVVDRVQGEVPDTLLLAEAFWLMEGYFVRTLGMHRVYNSAFMNMLKMEDNWKYRQTLKDVLTFTPEVLKRFVNFMNNPDEEPAVEQFGDGDKYIGVCLMMVTLPGLPMFGHGQIEGFHEKYGMEYPRAYWDERVNEHLVRRHEREIFPLMRRRWLFSHAQRFALYDFHTPEGQVNENVFAYSNREGDQRALVFYNNAYEGTSGWIHTSTPINVGRGGETHLERRSLLSALDLSARGDVLYAFRDHGTDLWYLRTGEQIDRQGLFVALGGYGYHVFLDWREIPSPDGTWWRLAEELGGRGMRDLDGARLDLVWRAARQAFERALRPRHLHRLVEQAGGKAAAGAPDPGEGVDEALQQVLDEAARQESSRVEAAPVLDAARRRLRALAALHRAVEGDLDAPEVRAARDAGAPPTPARPWRLGHAWALAASLGETFAEAADRLARWRLAGVLVDSLGDPWAYEHGGGAWLVPALLSADAARLDRGFFEHPDVMAWLYVHDHAGVTWYDGERTRALLVALALVRELEGLATARGDASLRAVKKAVDASGWHWEGFLAALPPREEVPDDPPEPTVDRKPTGKGKAKRAPKAPGGKR